MSGRESKLLLLAMTAINRINPILQALNLSGELILSILLPEHLHLIHPACASQDSVRLEIAKDILNPYA